LIQITASELRAGYSNFTTCTVSNKEGSSDWSDVKLTVVASININLGCCIQEKNGTIFQVFNFKLLTINLSW